MLAIFNFNNNMKSFIQHIAKFLAILILIIVIVLWLGGMDSPIDVESDYMAAIIDKHSRLKETSSPRILLVGGSNIVFGFDSERIEKEFEVPVVNLGLHGGLGMQFIMNELKSILNDGDIICLSLEYSMPLDGNYRLQKRTASYFPEAFDYISNYPDPIKEIDSRIKNIRRMANYLYQSAMKTIEGSNSLVTDDGIEVYSRKAFNSYGDNISHLNKKPPYKLRIKMVSMNQYYKKIDELNKLFHFANKKNAKVYFFYPSYAQTAYEMNKITIVEYQFDIKRDLNIPVLNNPKDFVFNDSLFYDTVYHLNKEGRKIRTEEFINILKKYLQ